MTIPNLKYRLSKHYIYILFALCALPRIGLWMVNTEGNDDHITPIQKWQETGIYPEARDCWECFQPPLFYSIVKPCCELLSITSTEDIFNVIQNINLIISLLVLWLIVWYINSLKLTQLLSTALILFWGLNPELVSIGALASNDILTILLGMAFTIMALSYIPKSNLKREIILVILLILLGLTKGNGLVFIGIYPILIGLSILITRKILWKQITRQFIVWSFAFITIAWAGNYLDKYEKYENPFITNVDPPYEKATWDTPGDMVFRKGVNTYKEAFFSFPLGSLIAEPYNENGLENYPEHRQNLWTQLLGQFSNHLFERYPETWISYNNDMYNFARVNFLLHIILFLGVITRLILTLAKQTQVDFQLIAHMLISTIFLVFVIKYSAQYRDFSFMKVVFIYPAFVSLMHLSAKGIAQWKYVKLFTYLLVACAILYQVNYIYLLKSLTA
ncbi:hypothetical protein OAJ52_05265 [Bacteroidia bacterium]|nr:hypothetical protein [bacterium]MDC0105368.1 hypothetical protein [Bacteroidia bacterium]